MIDEDKVSRLLAPFSASDIEFLDKGGGSFAYVSHPACTRRLIEVFGLEWSFEIAETKIEGEQVAVLGRLTAGCASRMAWGGSRVMKGDLDDALKGAGSFALKKCASLFGIGLHLWENPPTRQENQRALREEQRTATPTVSPPSSQPAQAATPTPKAGAEAAPTAHTAERVRADRKAPPPTGGQRHSPPAAPPATEKQLHAIASIGRSMGWSSEALRQHAIDHFGSPTNQLTAKQASEMISKLQEIKKTAA